MPNRPRAAARADAGGDVRPVPVYVRAAEDGWELVESSTDTSIESYGSVRDALDAALGIDEIGGALKTPVLRTDGEPDGEWRWLDASAEEPTAIGGVRISAGSLWEMAAGLNASPKPVVVDGGAVDGLAPSDVHGTALDSGTLANGWAHVGLVVLDAGEQTHLYLRTELLPEVAAEVDRGRLAYGSIHFRHDGTDDDGAPISPELASHALTNDPAVTNLTPGSGVRGGGQLCVRTRRTTTMTQPKTDTTRGPAGDALAKIAELLGVTIDEAEEAYGPIYDKIGALQQAAQVEGMLAGAAAEGGEAAASAASGQSAGTREEGEELAALEGEELTAWVDAMLALGREVTGKADATHAELLDLLTAGKEPLAAALMPADDPPAEGEGGEAAMSGGRAEATEIALRSANDSLRSELEALRSEKVERETADWLDEQVRTRGLAMPDERRARLLAIAVRNGREVVEEALDMAHRPPSGTAMRAPGPGAARVDGGAETADAVIERFETELRADLVAKGTAARDMPPGHILYAKARRRAQRAYPGLFTTTDTGAPSALNGA